MLSMTLTQSMAGDISSSSSSSGSSTESFASSASSRSSSSSSSRVGRTGRHSDTESQEASDYLRHAHKRNRPLPRQHHEIAQPSMAFVRHNDDDSDLGGYEIEEGMPEAGASTTAHYSSRSHGGNPQQGDRDARSGRELKIDSDNQQRGRFDREPPSGSASSSDRRSRRASHDLESKPLDDPYSDSNPDDDDDDVGDGSMYPTSGQPISGKHNAAMMKRSMDTARAPASENEALATLARRGSSNQGSSSGASGNGGDGGRDERLNPSGGVQEWHTQDHRQHERTSDRHRTAPVGADRRTAPHSNEPSTYSRRSLSSAAASASAYDFY